MLLVGIVKFQLKLFSDLISFGKKINCMFLILENRGVVVEPDAQELGQSSS